jgi:hypothetical protein
MTLDMTVARFCNFEILYNNHPCSGRFSPAGARIGADCLANTP